MTRLLTRIGATLCSYEWHHVALVERYYDPQLSGGYQGPCVRCGAWTVKGQAS